MIYSFVKLVLRRTYLAHFTLQIQEKHDGLSILEVSKEALNLSHRQFKSAKYHGKIELDGMQANSNVIVKKGQLLTIETKDQETQHYIPYSLQIPIIYEDEHIWVVDKPATLPSVPSPKKDTPTLANALFYTVGMPEHFIYRAINRLDKGTSGLMIIAKTAHAQQLLQRQLHTTNFKRKYLAITEGRFPHSNGSIYAPIAKVNTASIRREVIHNGKLGITHFKRELICKERTLLSLWLETGRTHQIRVHLSHLGFPLVGDFCYGQECSNLPMRFALHSAEISLLHPITQKPLQINSSLPPELYQLLN